MQLKLIGELASGIWKAASGNEYPISPEGILEIPDEMGADCSEAIQTTLFEPVAPEADRLGGSSGATVMDEP